MSVVNTAAGRKSLWRQPLLYAFSPALAAMVIALLATAAMLVTCVLVAIVLIEGMDRMLDVIGKHSSRCRGKSARISR